jgi:hypothetical protein
MVGVADQEDSASDNIMWTEIVKAFGQLSSAIRVLVVIALLGCVITITALVVGGMILGRSVDIFGIKVSESPRVAICSRLIDKIAGLHTNYVGGLNSEIGQLRQNAADLIKKIPIDNSILAARVDLFTTKSNEWETKAKELNALRVEWVEQNGYNRKSSL